MKKMDNLIKKTQYFYNFMLSYLLVVSMIINLLVVWQVNHKSTSMRRRAKKSRSSKNPTPCTVVVMKYEGC